MSRRSKRLLLLMACSPVALALVLLAEVQHARSGARLPDEEGSRPVDLLVGDDVAGDPIRIVWLGDSITTGVGVADFEQSVAFRSADAAAAGTGRPVRLTVLGVSGARLADVVGEQVGRLAAADPDVVVINVGGNDVNHLTSRSDFRSDYDRLLVAVDVAAPDAEVVLMGVPDMGSIARFLQPLRFLAGERGEQLDGVVETIARREGHQYVDVAADTGPYFRSEPERMYAADDFHPSAEGYRIWFEAVRGEINTAARRTVAADSVG